MSNKVVKKDTKTVGTLAALAGVYELKIAVIDKLRERGVVQVEVDGIKATFLTPQEERTLPESTKKSNGEVADKTLEELEMWSAG